MPESFFKDQNFPFFIFVSNRVTFSYDRLKGDFLKEKYQVLVLV